MFFLYSYITSATHEASLTKFDHRSSISLIAMIYDNLKFNFKFLLLAVATTVSF